MRLCVLVCVYVCTCVFVCCFCSCVNIAGCMGMRIWWFVCLFMRWCVRVLGWLSVCSCVCVCERLRV